MPLSQADITLSLARSRSDRPITTRTVTIPGEPQLHPMWWNRRTLQWQWGPKQKTLTPEQREARHAAARQRKFERAIAARPQHARRVGRHHTRRKARARRDRTARRRDPKTSRTSKEARRFLRHKDPVQLYCRFAPDGCGGWRLTVPTWLTTEQAAALKGDPTLGPRVTTSLGVISGAQCHEVGCQNALIAELFCRLQAARKWLARPTLPTRGLLAPVTPTAPQPPPTDRSGWWHVMVGPAGAGFVTAFLPPPKPDTLSTEYGQYIVATTWQAINSGSVPPWRIIWTPASGNEGQNPPTNVQAVLNQQGP